MEERILIAVGAALLLASCGSGPAENEATAGDQPSIVSLATEEAGPPQASASANPSFDCAKADGEAAKIVCSDAELAAMDRELTRLYALAMNDPRLTADRKKELTAMQRGWVKGRDECWKADDKRECVMTYYAERIHALRQGYAIARSDDDAGVSTGPVAVACDGMDFGVSATFVQTDPGAVYLQWKENGIALAHVPSASGAKYEGTWNGAKSTLFTKGDDAMLALPGEKERTCRIEEIG